MPRVKTDLWVNAWCRRARAEGAFATVAKKGAAEAGTIFVLVNRLDGAFDLYGPAPQTAFDEDQPLDRQFSHLLVSVSEDDTASRIAQERRFDSDLWLVEVEDRAGRAFIVVVD
ncbi:MAG: DUF1491 family protein [Alphaproteobacteria bacterium]